MTQDYQGPQAPQPPDELVQEWRDALWAEGVPTTPISRELANRAAAWGWEQAMTTLAEREQAAADAELKACCYTLLGHFRSTTWSNGNTCGNMTAMVSRLRAARRPKPPTMAERGLSVLDTCGDNIHPAHEQALRAILLRLQELKQAATATTETTHD